MQISRTKFILSLVGAFIIGIMITGAACRITMEPSTSLSDNKLDEIQKNIDSYYLNDYDQEDLVEGAYKGYVEGLGDVYSEYMTAQEYESWNISTSGSYSGVGMTLSADDDGNFCVLSVYKDSPAEKAGIEAGDYVIAVDGKTYTSVDTLAANIRGEDGTDVTVTIVRDGKEKDYTMTRSEISQESVEYEMLDDKVGYIKISSFIENTAEDFEAALEEVEKEGAESLILDLRDNGGGLVNECVEIADQFLDEGVVCYVTDKNGDSSSYDATDGKTDLETVVLVNENSASASEILSAAMHDNGYKLVGKKTYGKGVIQSTVEFDDGSALKLTIMQYLSPNKNEINGKGIKPDYKIADDEDTDTDEQLEKAKSLLK